MTRIQKTTASLSLALLAGTTLANPVQGRYLDTPNCDNHGLLQAIEELGNAPFFPIDELIDSSDTPTTLSACPSDNPGQVNFLVTMTNLTNVPWTDLFYVADPETTFSNIDGMAGSFAAPGFDTPAFKIDSLGINRPLVFESFTANNIFEPGETWQFIVDDYLNAFGLPASLFESLDFSGASGGDSLSSASIVQFVPTPSSVALLGLGVLTGVRRKR